MAAEEAYSCLQARPYLTRHLLWRWPSCHHTANTKLLHMRVSWAVPFVSCPACQPFTVRLSMSFSLLCYLMFFSFHPLFETAIHSAVTFFEQFKIMGFADLHYKTKLFADEYIVKPRWSNFNSVYSWYSFYLDSHYDKTSGCPLTFNLLYDNQRMSCHYWQMHNSQPVISVQLQ